MEAHVGDVKAHEQFGDRLVPELVSRRDQDRLL